MKKIAIIGASYLQEPLITKAKKMGLETHVFAWKANDIGEKIADYFYPISITEKEDILNKCREIGIDGICSIASDLAAVAVNYVANHMGLIGNSEECTLKSTNKRLMRKCFEENGDPSPKSICVESVLDLDDVDMGFPVIVNPLDRSGSRGITKVTDKSNLDAAIELAKEQGFEKKALVEEYVSGDEYSVECISWRGEHTLLNITKKYTTGAPHFIETGHMEPAMLSEEIKIEVKNVIFHALNSLGIEYGASHSEIKIDNGLIRIIEIGGRMGGDYIGSHLVELSTGFDFVKAVILTSLGQRPDLTMHGKLRYAAVRFIFDKKDIEIYNDIKNNNPESIILEDIHEIFNENITDSSNRNGAFIVAGESIDKICSVFSDEK